MIKYFYFISLNFIFKFQWSFQNFFNFWDQIIWLHNFTEFFLFHLLQMWWHILLMYHHLLIHGDGLWYAKKMTLYLFIYYHFFLIKISVLWIQASDQPILIDAVEMDKRIEARIDGKLLYLDGVWFHSSTIMNKAVSKSYVHTWNSIPNQKFSH
jgi:hypothetical protein